MCLQQTFGGAEGQHISIERDAANGGERSVVQELVGVDHRGNVGALLPRDLQGVAVHIVLGLGLGI